MKRLIRHPGAALLGLVLALSGAAFTAVHAQDADKTRVETNLVLVDVLVLDRKNQFVKGLTADRFELFIDGERRAIENFSAEASPVSFGIVFDMHPATAERTRSVIESLREFKNGLMPSDDIFLMAFNPRGQQTFDFVPTVDQLETFMSGPSLREPHSLYDAIYFAADKLRNSANKKRALIVISDTADHDSRRYVEEAQANVQSVRGEIFAVIAENDNRYGYRDLTHTGRDIFREANDASPLDRAAVEDMAAKSGGGTYTGISQSAARMLAVYKQIASEMRAHYELGFYADAMDAREHKVRVRLNGTNGSKDLVLSYRPVY